MTRTVAEPAVTVLSKPSVNFSTVLRPPEKVANETLFAFVPLVRDMTMPFTSSLALKVPLVTRSAPPRPAVSWLATVIVPLTLSVPPSTESELLELSVPRPMVPLTVVVPPVTMKPTP